MHALPLRDLAGQVIVAGYAGTAAPTDLVDDLHLGGVIAFEENVTSAEQVRRSNAAVQRSARADGRRWPVFVSVDQEGGIVQRMAGVLTDFPAFMSAGAAHDPALTRAAARAMGAELVGLGFTTGFAPDGDVTIGPADPTIGSRSPGSGARLVSRQVVAAARGLDDAGALPVVKHFPGHGSVPSDSHLGLPVQERSLAQLLRRDLRPFAAAARAGVTAVMVGHVDVRDVDPGVPSSLSKPLVTGVLRERLGFDGLVVTDALTMGAVQAEYSPAQSAVAAIRAGADVLLQPVSAAQARAGLVDAVRSGRLEASGCARPRRAWSRPCCTSSAPLPLGGPGVRGARLDAALGRCRDRGRGPVPRAAGGPGGLGERSLRCRRCVRQGRAAGGAVRRRRRRRLGRRGPHRLRRRAGDR